MQKYHHLIKKDFLPLIEILKLDYFNFIMLRKLIKLGIGVFNDVGVLFY